MWRTRDPDRFVVGVNLPWVGYGTDVGASAWYPDGGLASQAEARDRLDRAFAALARDGVGVARVFLLCDARSGVLFDAAGFPAAIDSAVIPDIAILVDTARRHGVGLLPALLDFHFCGPQQIVNGVQLGGRAQVLIDAAGANALIDRVLQPILEAFGREDTIVAWDVINEPEWCAVPFDAMRAFLDGAVACVHRVATQPVTVGSAGTWKLDLVRTLDLDFFQIHWYDRFGWRELALPVARLGLGARPVILGEFSGLTPRPAHVLETAQRAGYEGALVWSMLASDEYSAYPPAVAEWIRSARSDVT
jgi:hypothetical protein